MAKKKKKRKTAAKAPPTIHRVAELGEIDPKSGEVVSRRDLLNAAAALGVGAGLAQPDPAEATRRGKISYVLCNRAMNGPVKKLAFSPGHSRLAVLSEEGRLRLWDTQQLARPLEFTPGTGIADFLWGRGELLLLVTKKGDVEVWDGRTQERLHELSGDGSARHLFSPTGRRLLALRADWKLAVLEARSGQLESEIDLAAAVAALAPESAIEVSDVRQLAMPAASPDRLFLATGHELLEVALDQSGVERIEPAMETWDEVHLAESGELAAFLRREGGIVSLFKLPSGEPWVRGVKLGDLSGAIAFSPTLETCMKVGDKISFHRLALTPGARLDFLASPLSVESVSALACAWEPLTYAWGGSDGRAVVRTPPGAGDDHAPLTAVVDPEVNSIQEYPPGEATLPYFDCTCTCNSVEVTDKHNERISQEWDSEHQKWVTSTQPCGTPIPAGAVCICNCVSAPRSPIWRTICTCNLVCTCNPQSSYRTLTYWY